MFQANKNCLADNEVANAYEAQQRTVNISYAFVPYSSISDSTLTIGDDAYADFYNKRRERFKRTDEARIKYAFFPIRPSSEDSADTRSTISKLIPDFLEAENAMEFGFSNSDARGIDTTAKPLNELPDAVQALNGRTDTVAGPVLGANGYELYRIAKVEEDSTAAVFKLRHIVVNVEGGDSAAARQKINNARARVQADRNQFADPL